MEEKGIPIYWEDDKDLQTHYVNHMFVSHNGGEFYIVFGELSPFVRNANMKLPDEVFVKPIIKIVLTSENMKEFLDVLNKNYQNFEEKKK